ncbi:MAG: EF-P beta-lysylation protein EpmB [Pseudomonadales bacterium]|nr:EF-P beta-lysylation protein EpmB [Pseudomonadales bacterium]
MYDHSWQWHLQHAVRDANELAKVLELDLPPVTTDFPVLVPLPYLHRIEKGNPFDPLLLQVLARPEENLVITGYTTDPVEETAQHGLIHKYRGRVLLVTTGTCAINCRYCFRRHFPYSEFQLTRNDRQHVLAYIENDPTIREVILSGGDPLIMPNRQLRELVQQLSELPQLTHLRIHTRLPIVIPQRVDDELVSWIANTRFQVTVVIHANHANELDDEVGAAMSRLRENNVTLLNQSVLLERVNNNCDALCNLSWRLSELGVLPYYLHLLDKVAGAANFDVTASDAKDLIKQMTDQMPGYLVPKLVKEVPGEPAKHEL